jgi:hypothetical protein
MVLFLKSNQVDLAFADREPFLDLSLLLMMTPHNLDRAYNTSTINCCTLEKG